MHVLPSIKATFEHKIILLTGATGFVGKAIILKLLRTVPSIQQIYAVIRPRDNQNAAKRLQQDIFSSPLFDRLRRERSDFEAFAASKVTAVAGDVTRPMLGPSASDLMHVQATVQIAIHSAASVRFNEPLDAAVQANCLGALHVLEVIEACSSLECHFHISTAFVNSNQRDGDSTVIEEKLYPLDFDVEEALAAVTSCKSQEEIQSLQNKLMGTFLNTYTLTKAMVEHLVVQRARRAVPLVILRPTVILATMPGFSDQVGGAAMMYLAIGVGVLSLMEFDEKRIFDMVPLDLFAHTALASIAHALTAKPAQLWPFIVHSGTSDPRAQPARATVKYFQQHPPKRGIFTTSFRAFASPTLFQIAWFFSYDLSLPSLSTAATLSRIPWLQTQANNVQKLTNRAQNVVDTCRPVTSHEWIFQTDSVTILRERFEAENSNDWWLDAPLHGAELKEDDIEIETIALAT